MPTASAPSQGLLNICVYDRCFDPNVDANKEDFLNMANRPMCFDPNVDAINLDASMLRVP